MALNDRHIKNELHSFNSSYRIKKSGKGGCGFPRCCCRSADMGGFETDCTRCRLGYIYSYRTDDNLLDNYKFLKHYDYGKQE